MPANPIATRMHVARFATRTQPPAFTAASPAAVAVTRLHTAPAAAVLAKNPARTRLVSHTGSARIGTLKAIDPRFAQRLTLFPRIFLGVERAKLTCPLTENENVTENTVFEDPQDAAKRSFVMRYALAVDKTTRGDQFAVRLSARDLKVTLVKAPSAALLQSNPGVQELARLEVAVLISFKQRVNGQPSALGEFQFTSMTPDENGLRLVLELDLYKRNQVYDAMTDPELACKLIIRRKAKVAVQVPQRAPGPRLYRETDRVLDQEIPFFFNPALNQAVYEGSGAGAPSGNRGLLRWSIPWQSETHVYYQHGEALNTFFYLPDTFKLARRPDAPHEPFMSARFESPDGSKEQMRVTVDYCAVPVVNQERLSSALTALRTKVPPEILADGGGIELEPLLPDPAKTKIRLSYPGADLSGGPFSLRENAQVNLRSGMLDSLTVSLDQFRALYDALFSKGQMLFSGMVEFDMGGTGEQIPFQLRMHKLAEPFASWTHAADGPDLVVTLVNQIESSIRIHRLDAIFSQEGGLLVKPAAPAVGAYPTDVAPLQSAVFRIPEGAALQLEQLDFSDVECLPDRDKILQLIVDPSTTPSYTRSITVKTFPHYFKTPAEPNQQVVSIIVEFQGGLNVELTAAELAKPVTLAMPVIDFVSGREEALQYRYKLTVVRLGGAAVDAEWRVGQAETLHVLLSEVSG